MKNELLHLNEKEIDLIVESGSLSDSQETKYALMHISKCGECREKVEKIRSLKSSKALK